MRTLSMWELGMRRRRMKGRGTRDWIMCGRAVEGFTTLEVSLFVHASFYPALVRALC